MRITFVCPIADLSGGFRVIVTYAQRLRQRGHEVLVVTCPRRKPTLREMLRSVYRRWSLPVLPPKDTPNHLDGTGVPHKVLDCFRPPTAADLPDADLVLATWWETAEWVMRLPASKGAKAYFVQHHEVFPGQPVERVEATYRLPMHKICVSQWLVDLCRDRGDETAQLVANAVDLQQFTAPPRGKQPTPTVGVMYSIIPFKGCDVSLKAFELARQAVPALELVAFGSEPPADSLPLPARTSYTVRPAQDRIRDIYAAADAWLFASRSEGFGLPILEAMACRTPVIGSPAGAAPELLARGGGILVPMDDPSAMAEAIVKVARMSDPDWRALSNAAHATASRYTWDDATDRFESALRRAVGSAAAGPSGPVGNRARAVAV